MDLEKEYKILSFQVSWQLYRNFVFLITSLVTLSFFFTLKLVKPSADDYCFISNAKTQGALESYFHWIKTWSPGYSGYFPSLLLNIFEAPYFLVSIVAYFTLWFLFFIFVTYFFSITLFSKSLLIERILFTNFLTLGLAISTKDSGVFLLSIGWPINTTRIFELMASVLLIWSVASTKASLKLTLVSVILLSLILPGFTPQNSAMLVGLFVLTLIVQFFWGLRLFDPLKTMIAISIISLLSILLRYSPGSKLREQALDQSMRNGKEVKWDSEAFQVFKWNLSRHINEAINLQSVVIYLVLGIALFYLFLTFGASSGISLSVRNLTLATLGSSLAAFLSLFLNTLGSVVAYLQTWHFVSFEIFLMVSLVGLGGLIAKFIISLTSNRSSLNGFVRSASALLVAVISLFFSATSFQVESLISERHGQIVVRDAEMKKKVFFNDSTDIPLRNLDGIAMTQDVNSDWVRSCYLLSIQ
jgi:hypothetical protein